MTYPESRYLSWALRLYGKVKYDLATSGMTPAPLPAVSPERLDDPAGWEELRHDLGRHLDVSHRETIAALGTSHAIWLAYAALASPGDEILVESPAYEPLLAAAEGIGLRVSRFERPRERGYALDPERVAAAITERTRLVAVTSLHNPSGAIASDDVLRELARIAASVGAWLVVDEVYAPFIDLPETDGVWRRSARHLADNVVALSSLTKCYGLGAHRFGWICARREVIARVEKVIVATSGSLPLAHAHAFRASLAEVPRLAARARTLLGDKRETVAAWMASRPDVAWSAPSCGLFGLAMLKRAGGRDVLADVERGVDAYGVIVGAGHFFGIPDAVRVSWSIDAERLPEGLARLGHLLDGI